jgi:hypothetical protein
MQGKGLDNNAPHNLGTSVMGHTPLNVKVKGKVPLLFLN